MVSSSGVGLTTLYAFLRVYAFNCYLVLTCAGKFRHNSFKGNMFFFNIWHILSAILILINGKNFNRGADT